MAGHMTKPDQIRLRHLAVTNRSCFCLTIVAALFSTKPLVVMFSVRDTEQSPEAVVLKCLDSLRCLLWT